MHKLKTFSMGGIHPPDNKLSKDRPIEKLALPSKVYILISQHIGAPAKVVVKANDKVKVGQVIAEKQGFVSANIHSSVSGTVVKIDNVMDASGYKRQAVVIDVEGDDWVDGIDLSSELKHEISASADQIKERIANAGIVGLGGATFPSHVKLAIPKGKKAEFLIINGVECEPYLTADHRLMLEKADEIIVGIRILMRALGVEKAFIGIENNKPDAIDRLSSSATSYRGIEVCPLKVKYPQGGEKQLIKALVDREVPPPPGLPIDVGCVVFNVGTVFAVYEAVQKNKPLVERVVTVTGKSLKAPGNFLTRIGTPVSMLINAAGGMPEDTGKIISGGPMMGKALSSQDVPVSKGTSGVLLMKEQESKRKHVGPCIKCAKCVFACPLGLEPYLLARLSMRGLFDKAKEQGVVNCLECGCCSFVCPANRPLLDYIRLGKTTVMRMMRQKKS